MTRVFQPRELESSEHPIEHFFALLDQLGPEDYPTGVDPVPGRDEGTAFFSAAAGLVRWESGGDLPEFPRHGLMLVGHNLDSTKQYHQRRLLGRPDPGDPVHHPMPTWRKTYDLLDGARLSERGRRLIGDRYEGVFFTNFFVGLKGDSDSAVGTFGSTPSFRSWCWEFLNEQITVMQPSVVAVLGGDARRHINGFLRGRRDGGGTANVRKGQVALLTSSGFSCQVVGLDHPSWRYFDAHVAENAAWLSEAIRRSTNGHEQASKAAGA